MAILRALFVKRTFQVTDVAARQRERLLRRLVNRKQANVALWCGEAGVGWRGDAVGDGNRAEETLKRFVIVAALCLLTTLVLMLLFLMRSLSTWLARLARRKKTT